jgi:hypothetical protein
MLKVLYFQAFQISIEWSGEGHDMIGSIAVTNMSPEATTFVCSILQLTCPLQPHMPELGRWADNPPDELKWTRNQHYTNIAYRKCVFDSSRDCGEDCTVTALMRYIITSMDENASKGERQTAIRMIIHLVGDMHNPVHMGYLADRGGNNIPISGFVGQTIPVNLHNVWDYHIPIRFKDTNFVQNFPPPQRDDRVDMFIEAFPQKKVNKAALQVSLKNLLTGIASETTAYVCQAYRHVANDGSGQGPWIKSGEELTPNYMNQMEVVVKDRISKAGVRLAKIFDFVSTHQLSHSTDPKAPPGDAGSLSTNQDIDPAAGGPLSTNQDIDPVAEDPKAAFKDNPILIVLLVCISVYMI